MAASFEHQMNIGILTTIAICGAVIAAYALIERKVNQRACRYCGFRVSIDAADERCPKCGSRF